MDEKQPQAVRPNTFFNVPAFVRNEDAAKEGLTDEERILAAGANTEFYQTLKGYVNEVIEQLDEANVTFIDSGATFQQIGENTKILVTTKALVRQIFQKVQDARDAVEAANERATTQ